MREIIIYEACDGTRFNDYHECECYEQNTLKCRLRICDIEFWDKELHNMLHPLFTDSNYEEKMDKLMADCEYICIRENIPFEIQTYIRQIWGWGIPFEKGIYRYDWGNMEWVREI